VASNLTPIPRRYLNLNGVIMSLESKPLQSNPVNPTGRSLSSADQKFDQVKSHAKTSTYEETRPIPRAAKGEQSDSVTVQMAAGPERWTQQLLNSFD